MRRLIAGMAGILVAATMPHARAAAQQQQAAASSTAAQQPAASPAATDDRTLRVCADPDNLPFSNQQQEGFENKIAKVLADELGGTVTYNWWPQRRGFIRNTLRARECDILIGVPRGFDPVLETKPYYRSTYYFVTRADRNLHITSLDDPALKKLKIGVNMIGEDYTNTPPAHALGARGVQVYRGYSTFYNAEQRPQDIIDAVAKGDIDVAIVWGPLAGYYAKREPVALSLVPLPDSVDRTGFPFAYDIALGVRRSDKELKARVEAALDRRSADIARILREYDVPTLDHP
ncbi:MAG TPA: substrate-binding domain-containing protein [Gemmatimonadaceae bacterium]|nr:substrate-binding domain-containing protein [Gemmatimonadaceae bacterium]